MKLLIDTNVVLNVLLKRKPFYENGAKVLKLSSREDVEEFVSASAITDIYYIAYRTMKDRVSVRKLLENLLKIVSVASGVEILSNPIVCVCVQSLPSGFASKTLSPNPNTKTSIPLKTDLYRIFRWCSSFLT